MRFVPCILDNWAAKATFAMDCDMGGKKMRQIASHVVGLVQIKCPMVGIGCFATYPRILCGVLALSLLLAFCISEIQHRTRRTESTNRRTRQEEICLHHRVHLFEVAAVAGLVLAPAVVGSATVVVVVGWAMVVGLGAVVLGRQYCNLLG